MRGRLDFLALLALLAGLLCAGLALAADDVQCVFHVGTSCPAGTVKFLGLENESGGFNNAHAQNWTLDTYANSLCCNNTNASINLSMACGATTFLRLYDEDNSHVQTGNNSDYAVPVCMNSTYKSIFCSYPSSGGCVTGNCIMSLASSEGSNDTNAHISECGEYSQEVCCSVSNSAPSAPDLVYPENNTQIFDRRPLFQWNESTDPEGDLVTYSINATCGSSCACSSVFASGISATNYTPVSDLCVDVDYNWSVTACDAYSECNTSTIFNFSIPSVLDFVLIVNETDFGQLSPGESRDTSVNALDALVGRNNGNILINGTINASALFSAAALDTNYYNYKAADNESGSIVSGCSQVVFNTMGASQKGLFCNLSHYNSSDEVRIDLNITVPSDEGPGEKRSAIEILVVSAEQ